MTSVVRAILKALHDKTLLEKPDAQVVKSLERLDSPSAQFASSLGRLDQALTERERRPVDPVASMIDGMFDR